MSKQQLKFKTYTIVSDAIEAALEYGWERRIWKHRDLPLLHEDGDFVVTELTSSVMQKLNEIIEFNK